MTNSLSAKKITKSILVILSIMSIAWVFYVLQDSIKELKNSLLNIQYTWLVGVLVGNCISGYIAFEGFRLIFEHVQPRTYSRRSLARLYFIGQLMKHLPGRVFGIVYQASIGDKITVTQWIGINATYMLLTTAFAVWVACSVAALMFSLTAGAFIVSLGLLLYFMCWQPAFLYKLAAYFNSERFRSIRSALEAIIAIASADRIFQFKILIIFIASWAIYMIAWIGYGIAWPGLSALDGIWLCGIYTLAWFLGYISFVSPSGLGVREAAFFLLATDFPPDAVAAMAVLGRVILLLVDFILGLMFFTTGDGNNEYE